MDSQTLGPGAFGLVIGFVTYRTLRRTKSTGLSDLASVIGAVGGATITALFPAGSNAFGYYGIGLAIGFLGYLAISLAVSGLSKNGLSAANEWLGEAPNAASGQTSAGQGAGGFRPVVQPTGR